MKTLQQARADKASVLDIQDLVRFLRQQGAHQVDLKIGDVVVKAAFTPKYNTAPQGPDDVSQFSATISQPGEDTLAALEEWAPRR